MIKEENEKSLRKDRNIKKKFSKKKKKKKIIIKLIFGDCLKKKKIHFSNLILVDKLFAKFEMNKVKLVS